MESGETASPPYVLSPRPDFPIGGVCLVKVLSMAPGDQ